MNTKQTDKKETIEASKLDDSALETVVGGYWNSWGNRPYNTSSVRYTGNGWGVRERQRSNTGWGYYR